MAKSVLDFCCCCQKSQFLWLIITQIHYLTVLKVRSPKPNCCWDCIPSGESERELVSLPFPASRGHFYSSAAWLSVITASSRAPSKSLLSRLWPSFFPHSSFSDFDPITSLVGYTETIRVVFLAQYPYFVAVQGNILTGSEDEGVDTFGRGIVVSTLELSS